ncbi:MAG TPA: TRAM domain-containing protein [Syntrophales bacterium]|nr:TRAM domain-containing protein [Syntrophales bacterium]HQN24989.1 TRAM domain-containing protein [Syntrophales bacterium]HQP28392.1 TRAM domain-containing protein [Syntrophales bacterium]
MIIRLVLILACSVSGYFIVYHYDWGFPTSLLGLVAGIIIALSVIQIEQAIRKVSIRVIFGGVAGMFIGLLIAFLFAYGLSFVTNISEKRQIAPWIYALLTVTMGYLGLVLGSKKIEEVHVFGLHAPKEPVDCRILDTSVIIDGRIADICDTGFIDGNFIVPRFVLDELQYVADSSDSLKRSRGRRGLDILNRMQRASGISIEVLDQDYPRIKGVDAKLVALAREKKGKIITNDFNLNKVAELQGIKILNVNELANAVKPVVLPGEAMTVKIIREGKEPGQGVAYLDDGTMIVVDNAQRYQGQLVDVQVTSVLQTTAGRMIFSEMKGLAQDKKMFALGAKS